jgi:hypothetical protein
MDNLRRIKNDWTGWNQVRVVCMDYFLENGQEFTSLQDSVGWRLVAADDEYFYLEKK